MKIHLFIVDPQCDFVVAEEKVRIPEKGLGANHGLGSVVNGYVEIPTGNRGSLVVLGADQDMSRVAAMIGRIGDKLDEIHVTLDSHQMIGIERPRWWKRVGDGTEPAPFTILGIHPDDRRIVKFVPGASGLDPTEEEYTTFLPSFVHRGGPTGEGVFGYLRALAAKKRYPHVVWPEHCVIGTWGWSIVPELSRALCNWERKHFARVNYIVKGNNPWTEHFSGVQAEVPDPLDSSTQINTQLVTALAEADILVWAGEALSHCVANTVRDVHTAFSDPDQVRKMVLLTDASSNVSGFEFMGDSFIRDMKSLGMKFSTTTEFLA